MSEQIEEVFKKYKDIFLYRQEEMKDFLIKYFEKAFKEQLIEDVQRIDATERIKTAGFQKELSAWRNTYRNIILSACVELKNEQKRYDYKLLFVEEKLDDETIEIIENTLDEATKLRRQFKFSESIDKIDEMIELIRNEEDAVFNKRLYDARREIISSKEQFEKGMEDITKIENRLKANQKNDKLDKVISDCEKIIEIADSIKKEEIKRKYSNILEQTQNEIRSLNDIKRLEKRVDLHRANENFEKALKNCEKIIEITETLKRQELIETFKQLKDNVEKELIAAKEKYEKSLKEIKELEEEIETHRINNNLEPIPSVCEKIIEIAKSIKFNEIAKKYTEILNETQKKNEALNEIEMLEDDYNRNKESDKLEIAIGYCLKIIKIAQSINRTDIIEKFTQFKDEIKETIIAAKDRYEKLLKNLDNLEKIYIKNRKENKLDLALSNCEKIIEIAVAVDKDEIVVKYSKIYEEIKTEIEKTEAIKLELLKEQEILLAKAKEIGEIIKIEENVLPIVEEFSLDDILGDISDDINESLDQIGILLNEHRVEVRKEIANKSILTSISGEVVELEKSIEIQEPEEEESKLIYNVQSGVSNPFDDVIEEAVISDLIPYNFEIIKVDLNGEVVKELPDNTLKQEGIELRWKLHNIQPKEKIEINYDLRRRISRTIIFLLKDQLRIIKTHSNINNLELEGLYEARIPFSNPYGSVLDGVIVEDIIPLYYLHFIKEPTNILPAEITSSKQGDLIKWNVGSMEAETLKYHYKLLELYKFEELKIAVNNLDNEGFGALNENNLIEALSKYREVINLLIDYIK